MRKKVNIVTFHDAQNYGAMLQAYALQKTLEKDYDVEIIDFKNDVIQKQNNIFYINKKNIKTVIKSLIHCVLFSTKKFRRSLSFNKFMKEKLKLTKKYKNEKILESDFPKSYAYIAGSDQIWNTDITRSLRDVYTLNFGDDGIKRISYAASIGNSKIDKDEIDIYVNKISKIDYISVREEDGKEALDKFINKEISVVLDPTLLITKEEWDKEISNIKCKINEKYILAYVVEPDEEYTKIVNYLSDKTSLKVVHFAHRSGKIKNVTKTAYTKGPLEFVKLIKDAEYVICTSFHATVFSIIFNKKFFVVPHRKTGSRVINLLDKLHIKNRVVYDFEEFSKIDYNMITDWSKVEKNLIQEREKSLNWLKDALK